MNIDKCWSNRFAVLIMLLFNFNTCWASAQSHFQKSYYINLSGSDDNPGTLTAPFKSIKRINQVHLQPGDKVFFKAGQTFKGTFVIGVSSHGAKSAPILINSYSGGKANLDGDSISAVRLYKTRYVTLKNLRLTGLGRKSGNKENGLAILNSTHIQATGLNISGFQKSGLLIDSSSYVLSDSIYVHDNGSAGITVEGRNSKKDSRAIRIISCMAENNPGDPTQLDNHSGNGIVVGHCTGVLIDKCTATNNGWDMPRIGNGPVGIWCYEADSVVIRRCLSYKNKTSKGAADGGGFDLDGGVTNSIIEYCFSYGNQGSGYCMFQYWGASPWYNNIIRYNISENDGTVSDSQAGLYIWNSSNDPSQFYNCRVYSNIIYNDKVAALSFSDKSENEGFKFTRNIFVANDSMIKGQDILSGAAFENNDWWSIRKGFNINGIRSFKKWALVDCKEQRNGVIVGLNLNPQFKSPGKAALIRADQIPSFTGYNLPRSSKLKQKYNLMQL